MPITTFPTHVSRTRAVWLRCAIQKNSLLRKHAVVAPTLLSSISTARTEFRNQSKLHLPEMSILSPANKALQSCRNRVTSLQNIQRNSKERRSKEKKRAERLANAELTFSFAQLRAEMSENGIPGRRRTQNFEKMWQVGTLLEQHFWNISDDSAVNFKIWRCNLEA